MGSPASGRGVRPGDLGGALLSSVSVIALSILAATPAFAQTTEAQTQPAEPQQSLPGAVVLTASAQDAGQQPEATSSSTDPQEATDDETIIVTGIRQSLQNSQNIKRNADTVVDAITAQDIGALPDRSVTEALQRIPGVSINRFAGSNDPDHFSVEGSGVVVRGLTFVRSEFNGRDTFSTGVGGQAINFADVPAELLGSVEVYKNTTAEMIEGGLSGTVNMNLRLPFDNKGFHVGYDVEANYSDFAEKWSPVGSVLVSNTWDTDVGRIGLLGAFAYSQIYSRADGLQVANFQTRDGRIATQSNTTATPVCRNQLPTDTDQFGFPPGQTGNIGDPCYGAQPAGANGFADWADVRYAPLGGQFRTQDFDRKRKGFAAAAQWESNDRRTMVTAQFLRSKATQEWGEHTFEAGGDLSEYNTYPAGCLPNTNGVGGSVRAECMIDPTTGEIIGASGTNWQGYPNGARFPNYQYDDEGVFESGYITLPLGGWRGSPVGSGFGSEHVGDRVARGGMQHSLARRQVKDTNVVQDHGLNVKFAPNDHWAFNFDAQYVKAKHDNLDVSVFGSIFADQELDITGEQPTVIPHRPLTLGETWAGPPAAALVNASDEEYFGNPYYTFWRAAMDHAEKSRGEEWAFRADGSYNFNDESFLKRVKFGARYSDRDQKVRYTTYNWGSLSEVWSGRAIFMDEVGGTNVEQHDWDNFWRGDTIAPPTANYYSGDLIRDYEDSIAFFESIQAAAQAAGGGGATSWNSLANRTGTGGSLFLPSEIQEVSQADKAGYLMLSFGSDEPIFGNVRLDGNIGVRYVNTRVKSLGLLGIPSDEALNITQDFATRCAAVVPPPPAPQVPSTPGGVCTLGPVGYAQLQQWATGITEPDLAKNDYGYFLPSLNLKFGLTDDLLLRLAYGRNLARPSMNDIRNFQIYGTDPAAGFALQVTTGNPNLKPAISDNFDASLEWYFAKVGSLTFNAFAKNIKNFFFQNVSQQDVTSNGVTLPVFFRHPDNYNKTGKVRGFELAYQQTYDFLPGILSGFGLSANYTYIKSKGLANAQLFVGSRAPIGTAGNLPLEQLSKHNVNVGAFYEKGPVSIRAAYNWRSKFLLTASDVIFPYFPIYNDKTGQLDASAFFTVHKNVKIGVQGVNLTNEVTKTLQQFTIDGKLGPRSYFMNDRRFSFIVRGSF